MNIMENGQDKASSLDLLDRCCQLVADIYGKPDSAEWTNGDFIRLSNILYKKTHVQISPNTLKRIFGKIKTDARYYPQRATRDALARYVGFADWDTFIRIRPEPGGGQPVHAYVQEVPETAIRPTAPRRKNRLRRLLPAAFALVIMLVLAWQGVVYWRSEKAVISLFCKNPEGDNPHSAIFALRGFDDPAQLADGYELDFGDGKSKARLNGEDSVYTHYYEIPGRYYATLQRRGITLDTVPVYLHTNGWTATATMMHDTTRVYPIDAPLLFKNGYNSITSTEIARSGVDTSRTFFVYFKNSYPTGIDGDNFELLIDLKTSLPRPGVRCSQVRLTVYGDSSSHMVDIMKPGCIHWTKLQFSDLQKDGRSDGLSFLGADLTTGGTIRMKVVNRRASLLINGREAYTGTYRKPLRHIYGLDIMFAGIGTVRSVQMWDLKSGKLFSGDF
jgi:hypothetical protein